MSDEHEHEHETAKADEPGKAGGETMDSSSVATSPEHDPSVQPVTTHRQGDDGSITHD